MNVDLLHCLRLSQIILNVRLSFDQLVVKVCKVQVAVNRLLNGSRTIDSNPVYEYTWLSQDIYRLALHSHRHACHDYYCNAHVHHLNHSFFQFFSTKYIKPL